MTDYNSLRFMTKERLLRCNCGCETILVWHEVRKPMTSKYTLIDYEQQVFCPNQVVEND